MRKAKGSYDGSAIFSYVGWFLISWPISIAIRGGDPNWALAGIGAGVIVISIPFYSSYRYKAYQAVRAYNRGVGNTGMNEAEWEFGITAGGVRLTMKY